MYVNVFILQAFLMFRVRSCLFLAPFDVSCSGVYFSRILAVSKDCGLFNFGRPHFLAVRGENTLRRIQRLSSIFPGKAAGFTHQLRYGLSTSISSKTLVPGAAFEGCRPEFITSSRFAFAMAVSIYGRRI